MVSNQQITEHFQKVPASRQNILDFCQLQFKRESSKRGKLLSPLRLDKLVRQVGKVLKLTKNLQQTIMNSLYYIKLGFSIQNGSRVNIAPVFHPQKHLELIWYMWSRPHKSIHKQFAWQTASIQALLCLHTGRRWIDSCRVRWEHVQTVHTGNRKFIKIPLAMSKGNKGTRNEYLTFQENDTKTCPVALLHQYWKIQGCPSFGFIFPCLAKNKKPTKGLFEHWDAYTCNGHGKNSRDDLFQCLGQVNGITSFGFYQRAAKKVGWKTLPHKHSFRRGAVVLAHAFKLSRDRITEIFGWKHDSNMPSHYLANELATTDQGLAWNIADQIQQPAKFNCIEGIDFAV